MHIGKNNPRYPYTMKDGQLINSLNVTELEKDLGVYVDSGLNFSDHIEKTISKAKSMCYLIMRTITFKSPDIMMPLYKALIRPILEYGTLECLINMSTCLLIFWIFSPRDMLIWADMFIRHSRVPAIPNPLKKGYFIGECYYNII